MNSTVLRNEASALPYSVRRHHYVVCAYVRQDTYWMVVYLAAVPYQPALFVQDEWVVEEFFTGLEKL